MSDMMNPDVFDAFKSVGVPDDKARAAATVLARPQMQTATLALDLGTVKVDVAALKADVSVLKSDVSVLKSDVLVLKTGVSSLRSNVAILLWIGGALLAMEASLVAKAYFPHG
jgi:phage-related tail protein